MSSAHPEMTKLRSGGVLFELRVYDPDRQTGQLASFTDRTKVQSIPNRVVYDLVSATTR